MTPQITADVDGDNLGGVDPGSLSGDGSVRDRLPDPSPSLGMILDWVPRVKDGLIMVRAAVFELLASLLFCLTEGPGTAANSPWTVADEPSADRHVASQLLGLLDAEKING